jgi:hypothetical protein
MTYSEHIYAMAQYLESTGIEVILYHLDLPVAGRIDYKNKKIWLNEPGARDGLMTLSHEGGHWLSYLKFTKENYPTHIREGLAYLYGWKILRELSPGMISRTEWREHHGFTQKTSLTNRKERSRDIQESM